MFETLLAILAALWYGLQAYLLAACLYAIASAVIFLLFFARIKRRFAGPAEPGPAPRHTRFVLLIPAHNEERFLPPLLASLRRLDYPAGQFEAVVIADNCTDATARLARRAQVTCLERFSPAPSDKTQALRYAAEHLAAQHRPEGARFSEPVVCIIDADCVLAPDYLLELDKLYARPNAPLVAQSYRSVSNAFDSDVTVLDAAAEALRQWVVAGTRNALGQSGFIFGLGCSMRAPIFAELMALPITSLAEDKEWKVYLTKRHIAVAHCPTARLTYEVGSDAQAFRKQRDRWLAGYYESLQTHGLRMLARGLREANLAQLDLAGDLLQPPRSVLVLATAALALLGVFGSPHQLLGSGWWLGLTAAFWLYGALGLWLIDARPRHYLLLFTSWRLLGAVAGSMAAVVLGWGAEAWEATRKESPQV